MKTKPFPALLRSTVAVLLVASAALAQPPPGGPRGPGGPPPGGGFSQNTPPPVPAGDLSPLGPLQDKFAAFQRALLDGEKFYKKEEEELQRTHAGVRHLIVESLISDKISEEQGNAFVSRLCEIGQQHASGAEINTFSALAELTKTIKSESREEVKEKVLTPAINRVQNTMSDLVRFTTREAKLTNKTSSLKRRLDDLIAEEQRAKADGEVDDKEREKLMRASGESWQEFIKILKR